MKSKLTKVLPATVALLLLSTPALADTGAAADPAGMIAMAAGLAIGLAAFGGSLGQGRAAAALEGIARNPQASGKLFTPMIIGLALIESLVIYALVIAFIFSGNVG